MGAGNSSDICIYYVLSSKISSKWNRIRMQLGICDYGSKDIECYLGVMQMNKLNIILIIFSLSLLFVHVLQDPNLSSIWDVPLAWVTILIYLVMFLFLLFIDLFILRIMTMVKQKPLKIYLFAFAVIISICFVSFISFQPSDEMVLSYYAYHSFASGINPYTQNYAGQLAPTLIALGSYPTVMLNGSIVGRYSYPALYFLIQAPFFALLHANASQIGTKIMPLEYSAYFVLFLAACYMLMKNKRAGLPVYSAIVLAALSFITFSSTVIIVMLALCLILFSEFGYRHSWLVLGLMASLQQQLWILVLIYLAYQSSVLGIKKTLRTLLLICAVFLVINGYWIILNYQAFISSFLTATMLAPDTIAPIATILLHYGTPSWILLMMFILSTIIVVSVAFSVEKKWLPLLAAIPYNFLSHALPIYFVLFFTIFALNQDDKNV